MKTLFRLLALLTLIGFAAPALAQPAPQQLTRENLESWFDGMIPYHLAQNDMAGGEVVVVKDGQILFAKAYGFADAQKRIPADIDRTLFRPGSIAKVFTWTAMMQLVEQGKVDLDADVNTYLDFKIPHRFGKPVTVRNLMTHSAGYEERLKGTMVPDVASAKPLGAWLKEASPRQLFKPGEVPAYSNWSVALGGYIIERVSGLPYDVYIERHVLGPMGMTRSTFRVPPPPALMKDLSKGYVLGSGEPRPFELDQMAPAGSISATGPDMGRFMITHLENGRFGDNQVLRPETAQLMHSRVLQIFPGLNGMAHGFFEADRNGRRILHHGGNSQLFFADMYLYLDQRVGLYLAFNSAGKSDPLILAEQIFHKFDDRYFDTPPHAAEPTAPTAAAHAALMQGMWEGSRRVESGFATLVYVLLQQFEVTANDDNTISISSGYFARPDGQPKRWREVAPFRWREVGGEGLLAAKVEGGRPVLFGIDGSAGEVVYQPVPTWRSAAWNVPAFTAALAVLFATALLWPVAAATRAAFKRPFPLAGREALAYRLVRVGAWLSVAYLIGWAMVFMSAMNDLSTMNADLDPKLRALQVVGLLLAACAFVAAWNAVLVWTGKRGWFARIWSVVLVLAFVELAWASFAFKLITWGLDY